VIEAGPHPSLRFRAFETVYPAPLEAVGVPGWLVRLLADGAAVPVQRDEALRQAVRDVLRYGGYKPTGRGKPASEYLVRRAGEGGIGSVNAAVDACNAVSLHSGFPISVVDADRARPPCRIAVGAAGEGYVFNASGQTIDVSGLLCLYDAAGPCANAVKDSQRTKTAPETRRTLSVVWGADGFEDRLDVAVSWYRELLDRLGARTAPA
jgi:DNA/RNA-binding domain of Phe-tRNA-synthetase-like protein